MLSSGMATPSSYWCYRCSRFVRSWPQVAIVCPDCDSGFLEEVETTPSLAGRCLLSAQEASSSSQDGSRARRNQHGGARDRSPLNPVIVLRGHADSVGGHNDNRHTRDPFEFYYDDGTGSGLCPIPSSMSEFLLGSGFDRLLDQLSQMEIHGLSDRGLEEPPASKVAIDSMPTVVVTAAQLGMDCHCAVCMEPIELGKEAREMPCKHIYHQDCILPWLSLRNSCPVCRHKLPTDISTAADSDSEGVDRISTAGNEGEPVGLTIWRLPGGGFAVGRFYNGTRDGYHQLPVVYTEMDGGFNSGGVPRRISWSSTGSMPRQDRRIGWIFRRFFSFIRRRPSSSSSSSRSAFETGSSSSERHHSSRFRRRQVSRNAYVIH
ncbi:hypothetical protein HPP92_012601 [Vanilla planifolia]|uniref:RING-type E3 ubiquitin transferase n=1 Tax=Vanilla planifolia TaxID=51239 RepID=A0A835R8C7_VANPL|nr:hypothetical protein HPP92_012601 [Vanilla planifolia]